MATTKKKKSTRSTPKWKKGVLHPVRKTATNGRPMSKRDAKLFKTDGKRRKGVTPTMVKEAYGTKKKSAPRKRKTTARKTGRKPAPKNTKRGKSMPKSRAKKGGKVFSIKNHPRTFQRYVIIDGSGNFLGSSKLLRTAKTKLDSLRAKYPRRVLRVLDTK